MDLKVSELCGHLHTLTDAQIAELTIANVLKAAIDRRDELLTLFKERGLEAL